MIDSGAGKDMLSQFLEYRDFSRIKLAYLENQGIRHSDTKARLFHLQKLLINFGEWQGALKASGIEYVLIMPMVWLSAYNCAGRMSPLDRKKSYTEVARKLWPDRVWKGKDHDLAAATLLAELARVNHNLTSKIEKGY
jgi:hypothetical protein